MPNPIISLDQLLAAADDIHGLTLPALPSPEMQRALRRATGVPIKQLAHVMGVTYDALAKHEQGKHQRWASVSQERRARRVYGALFHALGADQDALLDAVRLGPAPVRGVGSDVRKEVA